MVEAIEVLKPKQWLYLLTIIFCILAAFTLPQSMSAPFLFLSHIEPGSFEFVNTIGLIKDTFFTFLFTSLFIGMLAIISSIINIEFREILVLITVCSILGFIILGPAGLLIFSFAYYCNETREFVKKMRHSDPKIASAIAMTMTFVILGLGAGMFAAFSGELFFEPESLGFTHGFGKIWFGCETEISVIDCIEETASRKIGYNLLLKNCLPLSGSAKNACIESVERTKEDTIEVLKQQFEAMGELDLSVGEYTSHVLAHYLNTWTGLLPTESKFILALIVFSLVTLIGFVFEILVPFITEALMDVFIKLKIVYPYKRTEESQHYVVLI